jgi:hypothetical protein
MNVKRMKGEDAKVAESECFLDRMSMDDYNGVLMFIDKPDELNSIACVSKTFRMCAEPYIGKLYKMHKAGEDKFYNLSVVSVGLLIKFNICMSELDDTELYFQTKELSERAEEYMDISYTHKLWMDRLMGRSIDALDREGYRSFFIRLLHGTTAVVNNYCCWKCSEYLWTMFESHCQDAFCAAQLAVENGGATVDKII